jgi:REP element-mobilizing transposase RayT
MPPPYTQLYVHLVWATLERLPLVTTELEPHVWDEVSRACDWNNAKAIAVGGLPDHVHLLARLPPRLSLLELAEAVKEASAKLVLERLRPGSLFRWQDAFGAASLSVDSVPRAIQYVRHQKALHATHTTWDEWERCEAPNGNPWSPPP